MNRGRDGRRIPCVLANRRYALSDGFVPMRKAARKLSNGHHPSCKVCSASPTCVPLIESFVSACGVVLRETRGLQISLNYGGTHKSSGLLLVPRGVARRIRSCTCPASTRMGDQTRGMDCTRHWTSASPVAAQLYVSHEIPLPHHADNIITWNLVPCRLAFLSRVVS